MTTTLGTSPENSSIPIRSTHLGYDAGRFGMPLTLNPYKPGTAKARHWTKAWREGVERLLIERERALTRSKEVEKKEMKEMRGREEDTPVN